MADRRQGALGTGRRRALPQGAACALLAVLLLSASLLSGCVTTSQRHPYSIDELTAAAVLGRYDLRFLPYREGDVQAALGWTGQDALPAVDDGRFDILALSSGGPDGAYGAGAIKGMLRAGSMPQYEIVTGVSTGALIAPFVFAGPGNEGIIEEIYTGDSLRRLLGAPNVFTAMGGPSLYPGTAIPGFLNGHVGPALVRKVAERHATGRRLLIATANLDANQLVIWDMGRIASLGTPESLDLFRAVLRAAIAIPGALPPVEIVSEYGGRSIRELHGDAGVLAYFYGNERLVPAAWRKARGGANRPAAARLDVILHNQIEAPPRPVEPRAIKLAGASVSNLTRTSMRLLLDDTIRRSAEAGIDMRYTHVPRDWRTVSSLEFDPDYMRRTFDLGYRRAFDGTLWQTGPR